MNEWKLHFHPDTDAGVTEENGSVVMTVRKDSLRTVEYAFESEGNFLCSEMLLLEYEAFGLTRPHELRAPFLSGREKEGTDYIPLCIMNDLIIDGHVHRITVKTMPGTEYSSLRVEFPVRSVSARLVLRRLCSLAEEELPSRFGYLPKGEKREGFRAVSLENLYNGRVPEKPASQDSGYGLPSGEVTLMGIPFDFGKSKGALVCPPPPPVENEDMILNFGIPAKRKKCRPVSRDSEISVELHSEVREIIFAGVFTGNLYERWGFCAKDPTILGSAIGEVMMPLSLKDVERYMVEILYEDGTRDTAFPYNIGLGRHVMTGETGLYAIPCLPKKVERVVFRNRIPDADLNLAALTLNMTAEPLIPEKGCSPFSRPALRERTAPDFGQSVIRKKNRLTLCSGHAKLALDISNGIRVEALLNGWAENFFLSGSLLKLRDPETGLTDLFSASIAEIGETYALLECCSGELKLKLRISVEKPDTFLLNMEAENTGTSEIRLGVLFPVLENVQSSTPEDGWYMFPKYQNALGNGTISVYEESAPSFPMQFMDFFSPSQNGGLGLLTKETRPVVRKYSLEKTDGTMSAFVEYPSMYFVLRPGETFTASETELFVHPGDWHASFDRYRNWLKTWYRPYKCQNKDWYRSLYWLTAEITDFFETEEFCHLPPWYNPEDGTYNFRKIMDEMKEIYGAYPDILHLWGWCYNPETGHNQWGHYDTEDYDRLGGLENLKAALNQCSEQTGAKISLYLHPTLLTARYPEAPQYQPELMVRNYVGKEIGLEGAYRMCHANETWRQHSLDTYKRVIGETGFPIYYVDEFGLRVENRCYAKNHGHEVPSNLLLTDREYISRLREEIDGDTVLYGEYAAADINARYIDCNISYHILDSVRDMIETSWMEEDGDDTYGRVFTDLYRFAFPKIVQLVLPMAMRNLSWQPLKSTFFNAESIYDSFWDAEESRGREFMSRAFRIKKQYADCFISDEPDTLLPSPAEGVLINRFPGKTRTAYNLYNSGFRTQRGALLAVPYSSGAVYTDVWNGRKCETLTREGITYVMGTLDAQDVGCIVEEILEPVDSDIR